MKLLSILLISLVSAASLFGQSGWRKMTDEELKKAVPEKAPVIRENIETELRTASGITNGKNLIFGVVIITAGYEAEGKYTHFLRAGRKMRLGGLDLKPDDYIFGYQRLDEETLRVLFYQARDGTLAGAVKARVERKKGAIYSFLIEPPAEGGQGKIYIGRFTIEYRLE
jgi:hypothetical protein